MILLYSNRLNHTYNSRSGSGLVPNHFTMFKHFYSIFSFSATKGKYSAFHALSLILFL